MKMTAMSKPVVCTNHFVGSVSVHLYEKSMETECSCTFSPVPGHGTNGNDRRDCREDKLLKPLGLKIVYHMARALMGGEDFGICV